MPGQPPGARGPGRGILGVVIARLARIARPDNSREGVWRRGEASARRYLSRRGYRTLGANVRTRAGEADLVMLAPDRRTVVVVEVKARLGEPGPQRRPEASITEDKRRRLRGIASVLRRRKLWRDRPVRIDVVAVEFHGRRATIRHYPNAV